MNSTDDCTCVSHLGDIRAIMCDSCLDKWDARMSYPGEMGAAALAAGKMDETPVGTKIPCPSLGPHRHAKRYAAGLLDQLISLLDEMQWDKSLHKKPEAVDERGQRVVQIVLDPALEPFWDTPITRTHYYMMGGSVEVTFRLVAKEKKKYDTKNEQLVVWNDGNPQHDVGMDGWVGSTPGRGWTRGNETLGWFNGKIAQLKKLKAVMSN